MANFSLRDDLDLNDAFDDSVQKPRFNAAQKEGIGTAVGAAAEVGASVIEGVAGSRQASRARNESRRLADIQRGDELSALNLNNQLRKKQQNQEPVSYTHLTLPTILRV